MFCIVVWTVCFVLLLEVYLLSILCLIFGTIFLVWMFELYAWSCHLNYRFCIVTWSVSSVLICALYFLFFVLLFEPYVWSCYLHYVKHLVLLFEVHLLTRYVHYTSCVVVRSTSTDSICALYILCCCSKYIYIRMVHISYILIWAHLHELIYIRMVHISYVDMCTIRLVLLFELYLMSFYSTLFLCYDL
jgi:hypothetical protein